MTKKYSNHHPAIEDGLLWKERIYGITGSESCLSDIRRNQRIILN